MTASPGPGPTGLRELLHGLADDQPAVRVAPDTWRRGRRAHRRRVTIAAAATAAAVGVVAVGGTALVRDVTGSPDPVGSEVAPALPSDLYGVPEGFAPGRDEAGTDPWAEEVRTDTLAVGVTAAVMPVGYSGLVAVSAVDGRYRGLDLPGLWTEGLFNNEQAGAAALSPDGTRLAYAWADRARDATGDPTRALRPDRSGVRVLDLTTGEVTDHPIPSDLGVQTYGFGWSPSGRWLAYGITLVTDRSGRVSGSRNYRTERLDTTTGERTRLAFQSTESPVTVSDDGVVASLGSGGRLSADADPATDDTGRRLPLLGDGGASRLVWDADGARLATGMQSGRLIVIGTRGRIAVESSGFLEPEDRDASSEAVHVLGWSGDDRVVVGIDNVDTLHEVDVRPGSARDDVLQSRPLVTLHGEYGSYLAPSSVSLATDLLAGPTRSYDAPEWARTPVWERPAVWLAGVVGVALLVLGSSVVRRRRARL
ncbi:hypothetical protein G7072_03045 [Nocardioides sp. HDW12B]|uniref:PD40 domain-containing protein n=1 Tax=Nocardioides sp. HDW12B TaxID=2714939 RepID=UPI0014099042|nr:PD40 domain-containing protein [Nocardioides sp. HDW12B]QIK65452.1 hypothetical protein G7072_03045 [Nocardioides sp. HDW12B]